MSSVSTKPPSGFRDFIGDEAARRIELTNLITSIYRSFGYQRLITPALENLEILQGSGGEENEKLIFKVLKRGEKFSETLARGAQSDHEFADLGLHFDLTVPLCRVVAQYRGQIQFPFKVFQIDRVWRAERPQKGRYREFTQCDVDMIGSVGWGAEVEVIQAVVEAVYQASGEKFDLVLNDRRLLQSLAESLGFTSEQVGAFAIALDKKGKVPAAEILSELEILLGKKLPAQMAEILDSRWTLEAAATLAPEVVQQLQSIISTLEILKLPLGSIQFDPSLARGMGYYTGPIFEIRHPSAGYSLGGGGRYDQIDWPLFKREYSRLWIFNWL